MPDVLPRRSSVRLPAYDYRSYGAYFVTIVAADRECSFGAINNGVPALSALGVILADEWERTADLRQNIKLDEFVVMPNHMHAVVWITNDGEEPTSGVPQHAPTRPFAPPTSGSLSATINGFKGSVTRRARAELGMEQVWQRSFFEHIIRNEKSLQAIRQYILDNPAKWDDDEENPANWR